MPLSLAGPALLIAVEKMVNGLIGQDPRIAETLSRFRGKRVAARTPQGGLDALFDAGGIRLRAPDATGPGEPADATLRGSAPQLFRLLAGGERSLAGREIRVEGDTELLLDLQRSLDEIDIRWEDFLQPALGDVLAGGLGGAVAEARNLARQAGGNIRRNLANFVQYEAGIMPAPEEMAQFAERVDELRLRLDRLQARIDLLLRDPRPDSPTRRASPQ